MDINEECCIHSHFYARAVSLAKAKHLKYSVIIHFNNLHERMVVLMILEAPQLYDQVLVEQGGWNIAGLKEGDAMEMLALTNFEVKSCKILNDAEEHNNVVNKMMIDWLVKKVAVSI